MVSFSTARLNLFSLTNLCLAVGRGNGSILVPAAGEIEEKINPRPAAKNWIPLFFERLFIDLWRK
jgi:hypothetical protein